MKKIIYWKEVLRFSKAPVSLWIILLVTLLYVACFNILFSVFVQTGINMVSSGFMDTRFIEYAILFCVASFGYALPAYTFGVYQEKIVQKIAQTNKKKILDRLLKIPYSTYERYEKGDLQTRIFNDCDQVSRMLVYNILPVVQVLVSVLFGLAYVLFYNWEMGVFTLLWIPLFYYWNRIYSQKIYQGFMKIEKTESSLKDFAERYYDNNSVIRIFHLSALLRKKNKELYEEKRTEIKNNAHAMGKMISGTEMGIRILEILNLLIGVYFVYQGQLKIGTLIGIWNVTIGTIAYSVADLPEMIAGLSMQSASMDRIKEILALKNEVGSSSGNQTITKDFHIVLDKIRFSYPNGPIVFKELSQNFDGTAIHYIVGKSGSGKSTLIKLMLGLYAPDQGEIYIEDEQGQKITQNEVRGKIAYVPQGNSLLHLSITENLRMGKDLSRAEIEQACRKANIHDWILSLPKGYDTIIEVDHHPSQGQAQRIAIARALALGYKMIIMDEPFSALDRENIEDLANMIHNQKGLGAIIVSHESTSRSVASHVFELKEGGLYESDNL